MKLEQAKERANGLNGAVALDVEERASQGDLLTLTLTLTLTLIEERARQGDLIAAAAKIRVDGWREEALSCKADHDSRLQDAEAKRSRASFAERALTNAAIEGTNDAEKLRKFRLEVSHTLHKAEEAERSLIWLETEAVRREAEAQIGYRKVIRELSLSVRQLDLDLGYVDR